MERQNIRDTFWNVVYEKAKEDKSVVIVSADLAAPALDKYRQELPHQYISTGIAEQNAITVAAGLALTGKKVFVYACAPFIVMRCYEQIKLALGATGLPVSVVAQGTGLCYAESGPTHHTLEDIGAIRMIPHMRIYTLTDEVHAQMVAKNSFKKEGPEYIRIDRPLPDAIYKLEKEVDLKRGFSEILRGRKTVIISYGYLLHQAKQVCTDMEKKGVIIGLLDVYALYTDEKQLMECIAQYGNVIVMEEHTSSCGLGSYISELCMKYKVFINLECLALESKEGYCFKYGGRENVLMCYGVSVEKLAEIINILEKGM